MIFTKMKMLSMIFFSTVVIFSFGLIVLKWGIMTIDKTMEIYSKNKKQIKVSNKYKNLNHCKDKTERYEYEECGYLDCTKAEKTSKINIYTKTLEEMIDEFPTIKYLCHAKKIFREASVIFKISFYLALGLTIAVLVFTLSYSTYKLVEKLLVGESGIKKFDNFNDLIHHMLAVNSINELKKKFKNKEKVKNTKKKIQ